VPGCDSGGMWSVAQDIPTEPIAARMMEVFESAR